MSIFLNALGFFLIFIGLGTGTSGNGDAAPAAALGVAGAVSIVGERVVAALAQPDAPAERL